MKHIAAITFVIFGQQSRVYLVYAQYFVYNVLSLPLINTPALPLFNVFVDSRDQIDYNVRQVLILLDGMHHKPVVSLLLQF